MGYGETCDGRPGQCHRSVEFQSETDSEGVGQLPDKTLQSTGVTCTTYDPRIVDFSHENGIEVTAFSCLGNKGIDAFNIFFFYFNSSAVQQTLTAIDFKKKKNII